MFTVRAVSDRTQRTSSKSYNNIPGEMSMTDRANDNVNDSNFYLLVAVHTLISYCECMYEFCI